MRLLHFSLYLAGVFAASQEIHSEKVDGQERIDAVNPALSAALSLFENRELRTIVVTKTTPIMQEEVAAPILSLFGTLAKENTDLNIYELDNGEGAMLSPGKSTETDLVNVHTIIGDTAQSLRKLPTQIDLLYLNSVDPEENVDHRIMQLREVMSAYGRLHRGSVVIVDGCGVGKADKCGLAKLYLSELSWKVLYNGQQLVMVPSDATLITA